MRDAGDEVGGEGRAGSLALAWYPERVRDLSHPTR